MLLFEQSNPTDIVYRTIRIVWKDSNLKSQSQRICTFVNTLVPDNLLWVYNFSVVVIFCLWFGLRPSCQVHITDNVGNNSISIMLNTVTSTRATQTVVTFYCLPPCTQKLLRHLKGLPNWIMIMQHENPSLIPFYHRYLICTVTVWRPAHLTFELGNLHRGLILVKVTHDVLKGDEKQGTGW